MQPYDRIQTFPRPAAFVPEPTGAPRTGLGWVAIIATLAIAALRFIDLAVALWMRELGFQLPLFTLILDGSFAAFFGWCAYGLIQRQALAYRLAVRVGLLVGVLHLGLSAIVFVANWPIMEMGLELLPGLMIATLSFTGLLLVLQLVAPFLTRAAREQLGGEMG